MYAQSVGKLIEELKAFPGIGRKTAERMAFHILISTKADALRLANAITDLKEKVFPCRECFNITDTDPCRICTAHDRDPSILCVVEQPKDLLAMERMKLFKGLYHVLLGSISLLEGVREKDLTIQPLMTRVRQRQIKEVIFATSPTLEGDMTALAVARKLEKLPVTITRIARGLPTGSAIETVSKAILADAIEARQAFKNAD